MVNPDYAINFINTTTTVMATVFGFTIIFFVFWYENVGKNLKSKLGTKLKGFRLKKYYNKFEENFFKKFLKGKIFFSKLTFDRVFNITKLDFLYVFIKEKTENKFFKYKYEKLNYRKLLIFIIFLILVTFSLGLIMDNIRLLLAITEFSEGQLIQDPTVSEVLSDIYTNFVTFMMLVFVFFLLITANSLEYEKLDKGNG